jgi:hypothetical protein
MHPGAAPLVHDVRHGHGEGSACSPRFIGDTCFVSVARTHEEHDMVSSLLSSSLCATTATNFTLWSLHRSAHLFASVCVWHRLRNCCCIAAPFYPMFRFSRKRVGEIEEQSTFPACRIAISVTFFDRHVLQSRVQALSSNGALCLNFRALGIHY